MTELVLAYLGALNVAFPAIVAEGEDPEPELGLIVLNMCVDELDLVEFNVAVEELDFIVLELAVEELDFVVLGMTDDELEVLVVLRALILFQAPVLSVY